MSQFLLLKGDEPPTPPSGKITVYADSATGNLRMKKDDGTTRELVAQNDPELKSITIELPTSAENISFFFIDVASTVYQVRAVLVGSATPSVTWTIRHGTDRSAAGNELITGGTTTTSVTSGDDIVAFDDPSIVADSFIWVETTAKSGTVDSIMITMYYNED